MNREDVNRWLAAYVAAWKSYEPEAIRALWSESVVYRYHPYDEPIRGREAVVDSWLGRGQYAGGDWAPDAPGTFEAAYEALAVDGELAVAVGTSTYVAEPGGAIETIYDNCFVIRFDADGRCAEFTEWFMRRPGADE